MFRSKNVAFFLIRNFVDFFFYKEYDRDFEIVRKATRTQVSILIQKSLTDIYNLQMYEFHVIDISIPCYILIENKIIKIS